METSVFPCPVCGRESNRSGEPFTDPAQMEAHIEGSHDSAHAEVSSEDVEVSSKPMADGGTAEAEVDEAPPPMDEDDEAAAASSSDDADQDEDGSGLLVAVGAIVLLFLLASGNRGSSSTPPRV
jgi:hypothetical protein